MEPITDHRSLIDALGGGAALARKLGNCSPGAVRQWKIENRVPPKYWHKVVEIAAAEGVEGIDFRWLDENLSTSSSEPQEAAE